MDGSGDTNDLGDHFAEQGSQTCYRELYKKRSVLSQEERRRRTLETQKKRRDEIFNRNRDFDFDEESEVLAENMEVERPLVTYQLQCERKRRGGVRNMLMHSEWMTEIPEDLQPNWYFVPSPGGRRCILIAQKGNTKLFSKWGKFLSKFQSVLPSGCKGEYKYGPTILDCIWSEQKSICYVLDLIFWKGQCFNECEAEFRFYWLKTKFEETPGLQVTTERNQNQLQVLPSCLYNPSDLASEIGLSSLWASHTSCLDGILFYHQNGHYYSGKVTPLVLWLKPFMLPEALGIEVPDVYLREQPEDYVSMEKYIAEQTVKSKHCHKKKNQMEVEENSAVHDGDLEVDGDDRQELESMACGDFSSKWSS